MKHPADGAEIRRNFNHRWTQINTDLKKTDWPQKGQKSQEKQNFDANESLREPTPKNFGAGWREIARIFHPARQRTEHRRCGLLMETHCLFCGQLQRPMPGSASCLNSQRSASHRRIEGSALVPIPALRFGTNRGPNSGPCLWSPGHCSDRRGGLAVAGFTWIRLDWARFIGIWLRFIIFKGVTHCYLL
jgi:hypothetical protein